MGFILYGKHYHHYTVVYTIVRVPEMYRIVSCVFNILDRKICEQTLVHQVPCANTQRRLIFWFERKEQTNVNQTQTVVNFDTKSLS